MLRVGSDCALKRSHRLGSARELGEHLGVVSVEEDEHSTSVSLTDHIDAPRYGVVAARQAAHPPYQGGPVPFTKRRGHPKTEDTPRAACTRGRAGI